MLFRMIVTDLRVNPGRNILTAISLFFGVLSVVGIIVAGSITNSVLIATAEQQGGREPTYSARVDSAGWAHLELAKLMHSLPRSGNVAAAIKITADDLQIGELPAPGQPFVPIQIDRTLVAGDLPRTHRFPISQGRWLSADSWTSPYEIVINKPASSQLGATGNLALSSIHTNRLATATIVGVVNDGIPDPQIYIKLSPILAHAPHFIPTTPFELIIHGKHLNTNNSNTVISDFLADSGFSKSYSVSRTDTVLAFVEVVTAIQIGFVFAAILALTVAALGIVNVGLASIKERSRELVIRRAVGATRSKIFIQVVGSSLLLSTIVAFVAILLSFLGVESLPYFLPRDTPIDIPNYPWLAGLAGTAASLLTSIAGSIAPGLAATRVQPAMALRT